MRLQNYFTRCGKCGKDILVQVLLCGVSHNVRVTAVCRECIELSDEYKKQHPQLADEVSKWKSSTD